MTLSGESSESNLGFFRDFISFNVCSIDLKSLLLELGTKKITFKTSQKKNVDRYAAYILYFNTCLDMGIVNL